MDLEADPKASRGIFPLKSALHLGTSCERGRGAQGVGVSECTRGGQVDTRVTSEQHSFKGTGSMLLIHELGSISLIRLLSSPDLPVINSSGRMDVSTGENAAAKSRAALRGKGLQGGGQAGQSHFRV